MSLFRSIRIYFLGRRRYGDVRVVKVQDRGFSHAQEYPDNTITNTKYTPYNFLFKNFWEQFGRFMNLYFLLIATLQLWSAITPVAPVTTWGPLLVIFLITATKEGLDDYARGKRDKAANARPVIVIRNKEKFQVPSKELMIGDLVYLEEDQEIPADIVILKSSDETGVAYIQTANLDGETDLKTRKALSETAHMSLEQIYDFRGTIECAHPNPHVYKFDSRMTLDASPDAQWHALSEMQTGLQATHVRNTAWIYGVVVYNGNETKVGMNKTTPPTKLTTLDRDINRTTVGLFILQACIWVSLGLYGNSLKAREFRQHTYLEYPAEEDEEWFVPLIIPLRYFLNLSLMIPISLKVSLDVVKAIYALFINWDLQLYDPDRDLATNANSTALSEELGQVDHIFSDKTGTLTENIMAFKRCSLNGTIYGTNEQSAFVDQNLFALMRSGDATAHNFFRCLALCQTVVPEMVAGRLHYKASSPDEEALVKAASRFNVVFRKRSGASLTMTLGGKQEEYEEMAVLEFSSDRKRMSVITRGKQSGKLVLWCKGADEVMLPRLADTQDTYVVKQHLETFANSGLRTLLVGMRELQEEEYTKWAELLRVASTALKDRAAKMGEVYKEIEHGLTLLGATAIEDKLQDRVPETIRELRRANIRFWMLTGDKYATAVQIATSCNLYTPESGGGMLISIEGSTLKEVTTSLDAAAGTKTDGKVATVIIRGRTLQHALHDPQLRVHFRDLSSRVSSVICCRVTPQQKAEVVKLINETGAVTLSIGDGGNDVSMIQEANVGVGISGREGLQAARAADYAVPNFKSLLRLCLIHGRYSYQRTSFVAQYSFYKSIFIALTTIGYSLQNGFSGTTFFNSISLATYNGVFTAFPPMSYAVNKDLSEETVLANPSIYSDGQKRRFYNMSSVSSWIMTAILHAGVVSLFVVAGFDHTYRTGFDGSPIDQESVSMVTFTMAVTLMMAMLALEITSFNYVHHACIWGALGLFYLMMTAASWVTPNLSMYGIMQRLYVDPIFWLWMILVLAILLLPRIILRYIQFQYYPMPHHLLQKQEARDRRAAKADRARLLSQ